MFVIFCLIWFHLLGCASCISISDIGIGVKLTDWKLEAWDDARGSMEYHLQGLESERRFLRKSNINSAYTNIPAKVPGDVVSDLFNSGFVSEPYYERNFVEDRRVLLGERIILVKDKERFCGTEYGNEKISPKEYESNLEFRTRTWVYRTEVNLSSLRQTKYVRDRHELEDRILHLNLNFDSIKGGARIYFDGLLVGTATDQFLPYSYEIPIQPLSNRDKYIIEVVFDPCIEIYGRIMACGGGWDWAPYSKTDGYTFGIVRNAHVILAESLVIRSMMPQVHYLGPVPR